jgi:hypothetical protein
MKACCKDRNAELNRLLLEIQRLKREIHTLVAHNALLVVEMDGMDDMTADLDEFYDGGGM